MAKPGIVIFREGFVPEAAEYPNADNCRVECDHVDVKADADDVYAQTDGESWRWHWSDVKSVVRQLDELGDTPHLERSGKPGGSA